MSECIHMVAATDNHYAVHAGALIKSVEKNHKTAEKIFFTIIDDGISASNKEKIKGSAQSDKIIINFVPSKNIIPAGTHLPVDKSAFPLTTYLRIFSPHVVPDDVKKLIFIDIDTMVLGDVSELWSTDLKEYLFGAVVDVQGTVSCSWAGIPNYKQLGIHPDTKYFNAGLLLINAQRWKAEDISQKVVTFLHENQKYINYADQYGLNGSLYNQWLVLDGVWNNPAHSESEEAKMIHFLDIKPFFSNYRSSKKYQQQFFDYLRQTPFKDFKVINGNRRVIKKIRTKLKKILMGWGK